MRSLLTAAVATLVLASVSACGDDDDPTAEDPATRTPTASDSESQGQHPAFTATDYSYTLEVLCFCPVTGPVRVTVADGEVVDAELTRGDRGGPAPEYVRLTIPDIIAAAEDDSADLVEVRWPADQAWPDRVYVDQDERAVDEEKTYRIRDVDIAG